MYKILELLKEWLKEETPSKMQNEPSKEPIYRKKSDVKRE